MTHWETIEQIVKDDAVLAAELARCQDDGADWLVTVERLFLVLHEDRARLLAELEPLRRNPARMIPVIPWEKVGDHLKSLKAQAGSPDDGALPPATKAG